MRCTAKANADLIEKREGGRIRRELPRVRKATGVIRALTRENKYRNDGDGGARRQGDTAMRCYCNWKEWQHRPQAG
jgi:hypothetical protein